MNSHIFLTEAEVSARLRVSRATLSWWRAKGVGPRYMKLNRAVRYRLADLELWLAKRAVSESEAA